MESTSSHQNPPTTPTQDATLKALDTFEDLAEAFLIVAAPPRDNWNICISLIGCVKEMVAVLSNHSFEVTERQQVSILHRLLKVQQRLNDSPSLYGCATDLADSMEEPIRSRVDFLDGYRRAVQQAEQRSMMSPGARVLNQHPLIVQLPNREGPDSGFEVQHKASTTPRYGTPATLTSNQAVRSPGQQRYWRGVPAGTVIYAAESGSQSVSPAPRYGTPDTVTSNQATGSSVQQAYRREAPATSIFHPPLSGMQYVASAPRYDTPMTVNRSDRVDPQVEPEGQWLFVRNGEMPHH